MITPSNKESIEPRSLLPDQKNLSYKPWPGSRKVYFPGKIHKDLQVPFREVHQAVTIASNHQQTANPPVYLYDTSGPYADLDPMIDIARGLPALRHPWILE